MSILVTGANGLIGRALCLRLQRDGAAVRAAVRQSGPGSQAVVVGDINASTDWGAALQGVSVVVHLAARVHVMADTADDPLAEFRRVNVQGTLNLARQAVVAGVKRFVFVSSVKVNGEFTQPGAAFQESDLPDPQDDYAISKHEAEQGLRAMADAAGLELVIVRPPLVYGPGVKANFNALMRAIAKGWPLPLGAIHNQRSLVALDNLVDFLVTCMFHPRGAGQTFLVSDGQDMSTAELARGLAQALGVSVRLLPVPVWVLQLAGRLVGKRDAVQRLCANLQVNGTKGWAMLGWTPPVTVQEGLRRAAAGVTSP